MEAPWCVSGALGGPKRGGGTSDLELVELVRNGLRHDAFENLAHVATLGTVDAAHALGIAPRTLTRRKAEQRLDPASSERVLRLARVMARACEVLGEVIPLSLLGTDLGHEVARDALVEPEVVFASGVSGLQDDWSMASVSGS